MYDWSRSEDAERFVNTYADTILRLALIHGLTRQDAQDICQELFIKLFTKRKVFRDCEHEKAWVVRSAGNACKNQLRSAYRKNRVPIEEAADAVLPQNEWEILEIIRALPEKARTAVSLYYLEGCSVDETAKLLGITNAAVRKRLERARVALKNELEGVLI